MRSLIEPLQVAMDNGARRALIPYREQTQLPRRDRRHHGARRPDILRRPEDGRHEGHWGHLTTVRFGAVAELEIE